MQPKTIISENPHVEVHKTAMAVAFNTGSTVKVDSIGEDYFLLDWKNEVLAIFKNPAKL